MNEPWDESSQKNIFITDFEFAAKMQMKELVLSVEKKALPASLHFLWLPYFLDFLCLVYMYEVSISQTQLSGQES